MRSPRATISVVIALVALVVAAITWALLPPWTATTAGDRPPAGAVSSGPPAAAPDAPASTGRDAVAQSPRGADTAGTTVGASAFAPAPSAQAPRVELTTVRDVWMRVTIDGRERAADLFPAGRTLTFDGQDTLIIRAGDAGAVRVALDGRATGALGPDGAVLTRRFDLARDTAR